MGNQHTNKPYSELGTQLKLLRTRANESLAEASGAVEIDVRDLASFELGQKRPSEDVLLLLISHFAARDDEAVRLWEVAGYATDKIPMAHMSNQPAGDTLSDNKVIYTDVVDVLVNNFGVVMNFMQGSSNGKPVSVAKVGMSREHAKSVLEVLKTTIEQTESQAGKLQKQQDQS